MNLFRSIVVGLAGVLLIGCASGTKLQKATSDDMPDWYSTPPANTAQDLYAVNSQSSQDMQIAVDKASTGARADIQSQVESHVQALQKKFEEETGTGNDASLLQQFTQANKIVVDGVLKGAVVKQKKIKQDGNLFRAYVLVEYSLADANKTLIDEVKKNEKLYTTIRASQAFDDLEKEVGKTKTSE